MCTGPKIIDLFEFKIQFFSAKHKLQCFAPALYALTRLMIDQLIEYSSLDSFNSLMYLESAVLEEYCLLLNDCLWFRKRNLKLLSVIPM